MQIRDPRPGDEAAWRRLWAGYTAFYQAKVPEQATAATWRRILDPTASLFARLAEVDGAVAGFCICVRHDGTWTEQPLCYLEDLFVAPAARKRGIGRALIEDILTLGRNAGWARVYWHTQAGNAAARRLYDEFIQADEFVRYRIILPGLED
jgi:GNAT superfamily N-acetyltransferase